MKYERLTIRNSDGSVSQPTHSTFGKVFYRLAEIEDDLESGKLVRLPCKVSQDLYYITDKNKIVHRIAREFKYMVDLGWEIMATIWQKDKKGFSQLKTTIIHSEEIGETVFLTREEAEAKLKELKAKQNEELF